MTRAAGCDTEDAGARSAGLVEVAKRPELGVSSSSMISPSPKPSVLSLSPVSTFWLGGASADAGFGLCASCTCGCFLAVSAIQFASASWSPLELSAFSRSFLATPFGWSRACWIASSRDLDGAAGPERFLAASSSHLDVGKGSLGWRSIGMERSSDTARSCCGDSSGAGEVVVALIMKENGHTVLAITSSQRCFQM